MNQPRAADDFSTIRARMEELRREREEAQTAESDLQRATAVASSRSVRAGLRDQLRAGMVRQVGPLRT